MVSARYFYRHAFPDAYMCVPERGGFEPREVKCFWIYGIFEMEMGRVGFYVYTCGLYVWRGGGKTWDVICVLFV